MDRPLLLWLSCLSLGVLAAACAPRGECQAYNDCPRPQYCSEGVCVEGDTVDGNPPVVPNPIDRDGGPGGGELLSQVRTDYDVPWLMRHPSDPNLLLFPEQQVEGGTLTVDAIRLLDIEQDRVRTEIFLDLVQMEKACRADQIWFDVVDGEDWYHCLETPRFRIVYDGNLSNVSEASGAGAQLLYTPAQLAGDSLSRVLSARRGGPLDSFQVGQGGDQVGTERDRDEFDPGVDSSSVVGIFPLEGGNVAGDHLLLHNRAGAGGTLVPITRRPTTTTWIPSDGIDVVTLDENAHAVWVIGEINVTAGVTGSDEPNYLVIEPSTGYVRYFHYETGAEIGPPTLFEPNEFFRAAPPAPAERLMLERSPSGAYLFYTYRDAKKIWRLPLEPGGDEDVLQVELDDFTRKISSIVPATDDTAWVSFENENLVQKVRLER